MRGAVTVNCHERVVQVLSDAINRGTSRCVELLNDFLSQVLNNFRFKLLDVCIGVDLSENDVKET